jgi:hypothetical protein
MTLFAITNHHCPIMLNNLVHWFCKTIVPIMALTMGKRNFRQRAHGGCNGSAENAYSSMVRDHVEHVASSSIDICKNFAEFSCDLHLSGISSSTTLLTFYITPSDTLA